ncbi:MAG TPA: glycosyltransferase family 2 protein [Bradyrhizobium sp.]|jgi:polyisoprenyl-phosphate glycosyltransferase|nr:glycosyltransferase family 2 protein [Bradyrhizobium sp.]
MTCDHFPERAAETTTISIVIPAHNEAENLPVLLDELCNVLGSFGRLEIVCVDDGSTDNTFAVLFEMAQQNDRIKYVRLSRNFGHQAALRAGLSYSTGDCVISMDADMQHPVRLVPQMVEKWRDGYDVVLTLRSESDDLPYLKRLTSRLFYYLINALSDVHIDPGSADFRLLDRKVVEVINSLSEADFFLRGIIPWVGFKSCKLDYVPDRRRFGDTKYSLRKMISFAVSGVVSNSIQPLRLATILSAVISGMAGLYTLYALHIYFVYGRVVPGWASVVVAASFIGGLQLLVLGVVGEYIGRILKESRKRPGFVVSATNMEPGSKK